jgi:hypothetical protein
MATPSGRVAGGQVAVVETEAGNGQAPRAVQPGIQLEGAWWVDVCGAAWRIRVLSCPGDLQLHCGVTVGGSRRVVRRSPGSPRTLAGSLPAAAFISGSPKVGRQADRICEDDLVLLTAQADLVAALAPYFAAQRPEPGCLQLGTSRAAAGLHPAKVAPATMTGHSRRERRNEVWRPTMPAVTSDTITLPRVPELGPEATERRVLSVTTAPSGLEGEGFPVRRAFAGVDLPALDPFVHMDQMGEVDYAPGEPKGTPWHPHRGFETVTYMIDGVFQHQDSNGGGGFITAGDTQWMTAGAELSIWLAVDLDRGPVMAASPSTG